MRLNSKLALALVTGLMFCGTAMAGDCAGDGRSGYPEEWWKPVPRDGAPEWEILPQDAGPCEVILSKRHELGLLSNFAATPILIDDVRYASLEGFWQMMKYPEGTNDPRASVPGITWPLTRAEVGQLTGFQAKDAGKVGSEAMKKLGINWVTYQGKQMTYKTPEQGDHYKLIVAATRAKVSQNPEVQMLLLKTGDLILKPDHKQEPDASPAWKYFEIYMQIRSELQAEAKAKTH